MFPCVFVYLMVIFVENWFVVINVYVERVFYGDASGCLCCMRETFAN